MCSFCLFSLEFCIGQYSDAENMRATVDSTVENWNEWIYYSMSYDLQNY